ncbi:MAG: GAF domain-containing protein [Anaerolinea sp.]|nr:GAF domain-containing protein [Anaerolinea sp.]
MTDAHAFTSHTESRLLRFIAASVGLGILVLLGLVIVVFVATYQGTREVVLEQYYQQQSELLLALSREIETVFSTLSGELGTLGRYMVMTRSDEEVFSQLTALLNGHYQELKAVVRFNPDKKPIQAVPASYQSLINSGADLPWSLPPQMDAVIRNINGILLTPSGNYWLMIAPIYTNRQTFSGYVAMEFRWDVAVAGIFRRLERLGQIRLWWLPSPNLEVPITPEESAMRDFLLSIGDNWGRQVIRNSEGIYLTFAPVLAGNSRWWLALGTSEEVILGKARPYLTTAALMLGGTAVGILVFGLLLLASLRRLNLLSMARLKSINQGLQRRAAALEKSAIVSREISGSLSVDTLYQTAVAHIQSVFDLYYAAMYVRVDDTLVLRSTSGIQLPADHNNLFPFTIHLDEISLNSRAVKERRALRVNDVSRSADFLPSRYLESLRAELILPLMIEDQVIGTLDLGSSHPDAFSDEDELIFGGLANQLAITIRNAELYEAEQIAKAEAETSNVLKSRFLANMSHELRTPLNSIIGYTDLMRKGVYGECNEQQLNRLEKVARNGQSLLALINDILDLSKIEAGKIDLHLEVLDPLPLAKDVANTVLPLVNQNGNIFELHLAENVGRIFADSGKLRQILFNLLSNASKFTQSGKVTLSVQRQTDEEGKVWIAFAVNDTGIGISQEHLPELFKEFQQVDSSATRKYGGSGLGLALSRHFCRMMGGDIKVVSELSKGSTFTAILPVHEGDLPL